MVRSALFCVAALVAGSACSAAPQAGTATPTPTPGATTAAPVPDGLPFDVARVAQFEAPFALAFLPDGSALVTEKAGHLRWWHPDGRVQDVGGVFAAAAGGQGGLLDIAIAPDFATSRRIYFSFAEPHGPDSSSLALARARLDPAGTLRDAAVLFRAGADGKGGQFGAVIAFAPDGKSLFLSSGERQRFTPAQDPNQALGKILHLTLDGKPWPGNPAAGKAGPKTVTVTDPPKDTEAARSAPGRPYSFAGANPAPAAVWSSGHRNPYGLAFDAQGRLWESEMGPKGGDELNLILPGRNYGWPNVSNGENYDGVAIPPHRPGDGYEPPKLYWNPVISPGGMIIYSGGMFPQWRGSAFLAALSGKALVRVALDGDQARKADRWDMGTRIRDVAQAPDGAIWLLEDGERGAGGWLLRLTPKR